MEYQEVWYLGLDAKKLDAFPGKSSNSGYDDENGSYLKVNTQLYVSHLLLRSITARKNYLPFKSCYIKLLRLYFGNIDFLNYTNGK